MVAPEHGPGGFLVLGSVPRTTFCAVLCAMSSPEHPCLLLSHEVNGWHLSIAQRRGGTSASRRSRLLASLAAAASDLQFVTRELGDKHCIFGILYSIVRPLVPLSSSVAGRLLPGSICIRCSGLSKKENFLGAIGKQARHWSLPVETAVKLKLRETRSAKRCFELTSHTSRGFRQTDRD